MQNRVSQMARCAVAFHWCRAKSGFLKTGSKWSLEASSNYVKSKGVTRCTFCECANAQDILIWVSHSLWSLHWGGEWSEHIFWYVQNLIMYCGRPKGGHNSSTILFYRPLIYVLGEFMTLYHLQLIKYPWELYTIHSIRHESHDLIWVIRYLH